MSRLGTAAVVLATLCTLTGCQFLGRLSINDLARCQLVYDLPLTMTADVDQKWNQAFIDLAKADDIELVKIGKEFNEADLRSLQAAEPYRDAALKYCAGHGWDAPVGANPASPAPSGQPA